MFNKVITSQEKVFSQRITPNDSTVKILNQMIRKRSFSTALLHFQPTDKKENDLLLFLFQNKLYAPFDLKSDQWTALHFSDYFQVLSKAEGTLCFYEITPVLFKILLVLAQTKATVVATSNLIDIERLLSHIEKNEHESVLSMKNNKTVDLFYFKKGRVRDAYFEETEETRAEPDLRDKLLLCAYSSSDHPLQIALHEAMIISPATDQEAAENQLSEADSLWSLEVLNGDREGERIDLRHEKLSFGRGKVDIRLNDPEVSRFHAAIEYTNQAYVAINQSSTNGLFVNDEKTERKQLNLNDVILLGDTRFRVVCRK